MSKTRRQLFKALALGAISAPLAIRAFMGESKAQSPTPAQFSGRTHEWKMTTTWPPNFPVIGEACEMFARLVEEMSGGRIQISVYAGGELAPPLEAFDTVRAGGAELGSGAGYYWAGKAPAAQFFATVPFGMNAQQHTGWILNGGGMELWEELYRGFNLVPFLGGNTGVQMGGWFNREINSLADIRGLKMRIPGLGGKVFEKAGGSPVLIAGGELYTNLERGVIDATEWLGPFHDMQMGFDEIARYYYSPGWHEPGTALEFFINKDKFDELTPDLRAIIRSAALHTHLWCWQEMETQNATAYGALVEKKVEVRTFPEEVLREFRRLTSEVLREMADGDPFSRRVYDSFRQYRERAHRYAGITEQVFYNRMSG